MENNTHGNNLQHHGVIGMKWGVRRYQNKDGTLTNAGKKRYEKELAKLTEEERALKNKAKTAAKVNKLNQKKKDIENRKQELSNQKKKVKDMTDDELRREINRLNLQREYRRLNDENRMITGSKTKAFLERVATRSLENIATQATTYAVGKVLNELVGGDVVNPKKGQKDK